MNHGLIESQLIDFMQTMDRILGRRHTYSGSGRSFADQELTPNTVLKPVPQILLLRYESHPKQRQPEIGGRPRLPRGNPNPMIPILDENQIRGFHFVLKVAADPAEQVIWFLDPENPHRYSSARVEVRNNPGTQS